MFQFVLSRLNGKRLTRHSGGLCSICLLEIGEMYIKWDNICRSDKTEEALQLLLLLLHRLNAWSMADKKFDHRLEIMACRWVHRASCTL